MRPTRRQANGLGSVCVKRKGGFETRPYGVIRACSQGRDLNPPPGRIVGAT